MPVQRVRRSLLLLALSAAAATLLCVLLLRVHLDRTLRHTAGELDTAHRIPFSFGPLHLPANPGFVPVLQPANLHSAVHLAGRLFLAGPGELLEYTEAGSLVRTLHTGQELPSFSMNGLSTGRFPGAAAAQLMIATNGAGLLTVNPATAQLEQLLPSDPSLRDITAAVTLPTGDLLLGTRRHGLLRFNGEVLTSFRPELRNVAVTALLFEADTLWIGTQNDGLYLHHAGITQHLLPTLPDPHVEALTAHNGTVYAATPNGVAQFQNRQFTRTLAPGVFAHAVTADNHSLTLALFEGGTLSLPLAATHPLISPGSGLAGDNAPIQQFLTLSGALYALRSAGLYRQHGTTWSPALVLPTAPLTDANIAALNFDPDDRLWVGTFDHGLDILSPDQTTAHHLENDHLFCINRIATDPRRDTEAVATANGLVLFDRAGTPRQVLTRRDGLINDHVTDLAFTSDTMTLATPAGLTFVSASGVESLYAFQGLVNNHVYSVAVSPDGNHLLAGTLGGLSLLDHAAIRSNLTAANSHLSHNWISAVTPLPSFTGGGYLLGTYGGGLLQLTPASQVVPMPGSPANAVINPNALLTTPTHLYAGTLGQGLYVYGHTSGRWQPVTAGLPSLNVTALSAHNGNLYVGTDNGLVHIPEANLPQ